MGIGSQLKRRLSSGSGMGRRTPSIPNNYYPPSGTHVGATGNSNNVRANDHLGRLSHERDPNVGVTGNSNSVRTNDYLGSSSHDRNAHEERLPDRWVMDPADKKGGSNVMDTTGAAGDPETSATGVTSSGAGTRTSIDNNRQHQHGRENSDIYGGNNVGSAVSTGSRGIFSSDTPKQRRDQDYGRDSTGYGRDNVGVGRDNMDYNRDSKNYNRDSTGIGLGKTGYNRDSMGYDLDGDVRGYGTASNVRDSTNYGRGPSGTYADESANVKPTETRRSMDGGVYNTVIGAGSRDAPAVRHHNHDPMPTTVTTTTNTNTSIGTSVGTRALPHRPIDHSAPGTTARDSLTQPHETNRLSGIGPTPGLTEGASIDEAGNRHEPILSNNNRHEPTHNDIHRKPVRTSTISSRTYEPLPDTNAGIGMPTTHDVQHPYVATAGPLPPHHQPQPPPQPVLGGAGGAGGILMGGHGYYGPGYFGSKVVHRCTECGTDNDISRYFNRDAVYRIG